MIEIPSPDQLKRELIGFAAVLVLLGAFFGMGYWVALGRVQADYAKDIQQANAEKAKADDFARSATTLHAAAEAKDKKLAADAVSVKEARARVASFNLPEKLPATPEYAPISALMDEVKAIDTENTDLRQKLELKTQEADQWHNAFTQERLRSLALEGALAAKEAGQRKAVLKAEFKGLLIGASIAAPATYFATRKR